jgi:hypothetical protein
MTLRDEFEKWVNANPGYTYFECYEAAHASQQKRIDGLEKELAEAKRNAHDYLTQAAEDVAGWGAYASDYFQNKHDLDFDIKLYQQRAKEFITATARDGEAPALDIEEFIAAKKYYTTIANPEEMDGTESVSVAELREFMHRRVATASPQVVQEPVASVSGYYGGHCVIEPIDRAQLLPVGMALYNLAKAIERISAATQEK